MVSQEWLFIFGGAFLILTVSMIAVYKVRLRRSKGRQSRVDGTTPAEINSIAREWVHEIRNPLNSINLNLQLLEEDLSTIQAEKRDDLQKRVRRILGEVERLDQILTDFRRYAKLPPLSYETCDLAMLIEEVLIFNEPEAQRQRIEVVRDIHELPPIQLDPKQFKQALLNLIINANQAMDNGGKLTVRAQALNGQIQIDVEDTGEGIEADFIHKIFDMFESTKEDGTGLGLTIVKKIIEEHGGTITVKSKIGHGTAFSILLPVK